MTKLTKSKQSLVLYPFSGHQIFLPQGVQRGYQRNIRDYLLFFFFHDYFVQGQKAYVYPFNQEKILSTDFNLRPGDTAVSAFHSSHRIENV